MADILTITHNGDPILRRKAQPINDITNADVQKLIDSLMETALQSNGVGIAAPQVSQSYRLFIVASRPNPRYPNAPEMKPIAMINPKITAYSEEMRKDWEGCLSVPGFRGLVPRYQAIEVKYLNREGEIKQQELTGFVARIFQHELDHLDGLLFLDRLESNDDLYTQAEYERLREL